MSRNVIEISDLGKQYRLGQVGTTTMADDLKRWWYSINGKEDPFLKIGEENDREKKGTSDYVWALKDINFSVAQGEVLGIIGKNGAGKSTLLKILSRTTAPTTGEYKIRGRVASLLEVGTGFHPDLTGRENVFLNGAILGMTKAEIRKNFDEIVDFSGVERYIDTPVKRYSSGMYVRLAFAVAAYLNPEILIVDEVLAVGDQEFQDKCLGKMKDVSSQGRTVLFVSHNMSAVKTLCTRAIILSKGKLTKNGPTDKVIGEYLSENYLATPLIEWHDAAKAPGNADFRIQKIELVNNGTVTSEVDISKESVLRIYYTNHTSENKYQFSIHLVDSNDNLVLCSLNAPSACIKEDVYFQKPYEVGEYVTEVSLPPDFLNENKYHFNIIVSNDVFNTNEVFLEKIITFNGHDLGDMKKSYTKDWAGIVRIRLDWKTNKLK